MFHRETIKVKHGTPDGATQPRLSCVLKGRLPKYGAKNARRRGRTQPTALRVVEGHRHRDPRTRGRIACPAVSQTRTVAGNAHALGETADRCWCPRRV